MPLSLEFCSEIIWLFFMCVLTLCVSSFFFFLFFFFLSAFSLNGKGLSETKNFLYFQTVEFVVKKKKKKIWSRNKDEEDMEIK